MSTLDEVKLNKQLRDANNEIRMLRQNNEQLKTRIVELERRQQVAVQNAYEDGYNAAREDFYKERRKAR
jgi:hypothetical protein